MAAMEERILSVEDERQIVTVLRGYLERSSYKVLAAYDGEEGLFLARSQQPDLIILWATTSSLSPQRNSTY